MAIARVQTKSGNGGGYVASYNITMTSNTAAGNLLVLFVSEQANAYTLTVSDSQSGTWTKVGTGNVMGSLWYRKNITGGALTITLGWGAGNYQDFAYVVREYSGIETDTALDISKEVSDADWVTAHAITGVPTTHTADSLMVMAYTGDDATATCSVTAGGYGQLVNVAHSDAYGNGAFSDRIVSATGQYNGTYTTNKVTKGYGIIAAFAATGGGTPPASSVLAAAFFPFFV